MRKSVKMRRYSATALDASVSAWMVASRDCRPVRSAPSWPVTSAFWPQSAPALLMRPASLSIWASRSLTASSARALSSVSRAGGVGSVWPVGAVWAGAAPHAGAAATSAVLATRAAAPRRKRVVKVMALAPRSVSSNVSVVRLLRGLVGVPDGAAGLGELAVGLLEAGVEVVSTDGLGG